MTHCITLYVLKQFIDNSSINDQIWENGLKRVITVFSKEFYIPSVSVSTL